MDNIPKPVNVQEQYLHGILIRMDALCHMMSEFTKAYAEQNNMATTKNTVEEKPAPKRRKKVSDVPE